MITKKKILYVISRLYRGGPGNQLYGIVKNIDRSKYDVEILTLFDEKTDSKLDEFNKINIKVNSLKLKKYEMIDPKKKITSIVEKINPDIIHTHGGLADCYAVKYLKKYVHFSTIHNYPYEDYVLKHGKILGNIKADKHIKIIKKIEYPIACSKTISEKIKNKCNLDVEYIQNGIDDIKYSPVDIREKTRLRRNLDINTEKITFISCGALSKRKDPLSVINAFEKANISDTAQLIILGDGELMNECKRTACDSIIIKGRVSNVVDFLRASDIYVSASKSEGLPLSVLEGMGVGLPVLISDIEAHKEIFQFGIDIGEHYNIDDINELSKRMKKITKLDYVKRGHNARKLIDNYLNCKKMSKLYQEKYSIKLNEF
ncbi:glycosyltransferase family 4 protein [Crassaminicella profunda]|uniref:glycosyltransferase family 4 protein n=1 Tax=Crassaminicella profunda TaxID=1286698 RepID=UPI001CA6950E|nr:glycosyltransferase family 4 protein [Crassaminicella profunda]QZY55341.1 glycosyltransferase family 4 protein [Crassaminicella profunda]